MYRVVFNGIELLDDTYENCKIEILGLLECHRTIGISASIVSVVTRKVVDIYYLDENKDVKYVAID